VGGGGRVGVEGSCVGDDGGDGFWVVWDRGTWKPVFNTWELVLEHENPFCWAHLLSGVDDGDENAGEIKNVET
jgi:hypothetical protein